MQQHLPIYKQQQQQQQQQQRSDAIQHKPVSKSCAVANSEKFWRATGRSKLGRQTPNCTKSSKIWFLYWYDYTVASRTVFYSVRQLWSLSGPPEFFPFSYCAWLWNLIEVAEPHNGAQCREMIKKWRSGFLEVSGTQTSQILSFYFRAIILSKIYLIRRCSFHVV